MLHNKSRKSKGEKRVLIKDLSEIYMQEILQNKTATDERRWTRIRTHVHRRSSVAYSA